MRAQSSLALTINEMQEDDSPLSAGERVYELMDQFKNSHDQMRVESYIQHAPIESLDNKAEDSSLVTFFEAGPGRKLIYKSRLPAPDKFLSLQKWEGVVTKVGEDHFSARLMNLTETAQEEEAIFPISEISSDDDLKLLRVGAVFYWNIGYYVRAKGTRIRSSVIRFRRLPMWTESILKAAQKEADRLNEFFDWK